MIERLTAANQTRAILDDVKHWEARNGRPHYGFYAHMLLLSRRLNALAKSLPTDTSATGDR